MDTKITELLEELKKAIDKAATTGDKSQFIDPAYDFTDELEQCEKPFDAVRPILEPVSYTHLDVYKRQTSLLFGAIKYCRIRGTFHR